MALCHTKSFTLTHLDTIVLDVDWQKRGLSFKSYERWQSFWRKDRT